MNPPFTNVPPAIVLRRTNPFWHAAVGGVKPVYLSCQICTKRAISPWLACNGVLGAPRSPERGYREISVSDEPLRTDAAILAALTALEGRPLDLGNLRKVLEIGLPLRGESFWVCFNRALADRRTEEGLRRSLRELGHHQALDYVLMLLRYHQPGFDDLPPQERTNLVLDACAHTNELLEALRKLVSFLEHGGVSYRGPPANFRFTEFSEVHCPRAERPGQTSLVCASNKSLI
jgi:hypothetical protein